MRKHSLNIAVLLSTFFSPYLFSANLLVDYDDQKEGPYSTQPNNQAQQPKQVCDYTILNNKNVNHTLDDIKDVEEDLGDDVLVVNTKLVTTNNQSPPLLLGAVLQHHQTNEHHQYLITSTGLLSETTQSNAVKKAHKKGFHLIKATRGHVFLQLLEWLQISGHYTVTALHTNKPVCRNCYLIANILWEKELETNEKGCLSVSFPLLDKMPNLAQQYINTHLNLSLVQSLVVPMMGYVSKEEMNKAIEEKDEKINMLKQEINKKDNQLNDKSQELDDLKAQLRKCIEKNTDYQKITEKLNTLRNKFIERNTDCQNITEKLNTLRKEFKMQINNIDIQNENSVKSFVLKVKAEHKQFDEDMQILRNWYAKYKGDDWKQYDETNSENVSWREIYDDILKKIEKILQNNDKGTLFSSILQSLKTVLSTKQAHLWGVNEALEQNSLKNQKLRLEIDPKNDKLQLCVGNIGCRWRWVE